jgi:penicillin-binding protein 1C
MRSGRAARAFFTAALALWAGAFARDRFDAWIDATVLPPLIAAASVEVLDREGRLLRAYTVADGRWRLEAALDEVDPLYLEMLIAYEDKRFWTHGGIDPRAMLRAFGQAVWNGRVVSGGSTLSMQVARLLEDGGTGEIAGKLRQMRVALALERRLTKEEILALYINRAPFGGNLEGLRAATRAYFGKEPRRLTPAEAALLVALPQSPETRRPDRHAEAAEAARNRVLVRLVGAGVIDDDRAEAALTETVPEARRPFPNLAAHVADRVRDAAPALGEHRLSLDARLQAALETLAEEAVRGQGERLSAAILVLDHRTGEVLASVGSAGYLDEGREGYVDMTRALRSPGSTLKPLVYGLAFDEGLAHPETLIEDMPRAFGTYRPQNFDGQYRGMVSVRDALRMSLNIPVVSLTEAIGPAKLLAHLRRSGAAPELAGGEPGLAVALGGVGVTLEDLARLYAAIARGGRPVDLVWEAGAASEGTPRAPVMSPEAAWHVADILSEIAPPSGAPWNELPYKTGTSYGYRDAWAVGFDGRHVVAVWLGRPDGSSVPGAFGAELAAPVLFDAFERLKPALDPLPPPPPSALIVENAELPPPLRRFRGRDAVFAKAADEPRVAFPPDGAVVEAGGILVLKVEAGVPPFTWLADGRPVAVGSHERQEILEGIGPGFVTLSVIDARGRSSGARIEVQ